MNSREIEELLAKYYEGETSLAEEERLRTFFATETVPPHLASHASLFVFFSKEAKEVMPDPDFETKFLEKIETPVIPITRDHSRLYTVLSAAASVLLLAGMFFTFYLSRPKPVEGTVTNPQLAYAEVSKALMMVSQNFNSGIEKLHPLGSFGKGMEQATKFSAFAKYQPLIINPGEK
jgi:hypothetical protein